MCRLRESSRVNSRDSKEGCRWKGGKNNNTFIMFQRYPYFTLVIVSKGTLWKWICVQLFDKERITFISPGNPHNSVQIPFINCVSVRIEVQINRAGSSLDSCFCTTILFPFSGTSCWRYRQVLTGFNPLDQFLLASLSTKPYTVCSIMQFCSSIMQVLQSMYSLYTV